MAIAILFAVLATLSVVSAQAAEPPEVVSVGPEDFRARTLGEEEVDGRRLVVLEAVARDSDTAEALGYGRIKAWVDTERRVYRRVEFSDLAGLPVTTISIHDPVDEAAGFRIEILDHIQGRATAVRPGTGAQGAETPLPLPAGLPVF